MKILAGFLVFMVAVAAHAVPVSPMENFTPSNHDEVELQRFWRDVKQMNEGMRGKDCFKRAHMWSWLLDQRYRVQSVKVFMHYTDKFYRELDNQGKTGLSARLERMTSRNIGWRFHVAPAVDIDGELIILDPGLRKSPESVEQWVDFLSERGVGLLTKRKNSIMSDINKYSRYLNSRNSSDNRKRSARRKIRELKSELRTLGLTTNPNEKIEITCKEVTHIMEVDRAQEEEWCYYQKTAMYYFGPLELRFLNYGNVPVDKRYPIRDLRYHTYENYQEGVNYVETTWHYGRLELSLDEFNLRARPDSIWHIR